VRSYKLAPSATIILTYKSLRTKHYVRKLCSSQNCHSSELICLGCDEQNVKCKACDSVGCCRCVEVHTCCGKELRKQCQDSDKHCLTMRSCGHPACILRPSREECTTCMEEKVEAEEDELEAELEQKHDTYHNSAMCFKVDYCYFILF